MGGYESLLVYRLAVTIDDGVILFCERFLDISQRRTVEQMVQASRSGKQNIVEGSLEKSVEGNLKLTGVARASYGELLEDFRDFLRRKRLTAWSKEDKRALSIRAFRESVGRETDLTDLAKWANLDLKKGEDFANLMICLIFKQTYLLDQLLRAQEEKFVKEGGFRENLFRKRREYKNQLD